MHSDLHDLSFFMFLIYQNFTRKNIQKFPKLLQKWSFPKLNGSILDRKMTYFRCKNTGWSTYEEGEGAEEGQGCFEEDFASDLIESLYLRRCSYMVLTKFRQNFFQRIESKHWYRYRSHRWPPIPVFSQNYQVKSYDGIIEETYTSYLWIKRWSYRR